MDGAVMEQLEVAAIEKALGPLPDHVQIMPADTSINTYSLFTVADYGVTVRGTIGMELPCFGVPVVTAGTGRYSHRGFTIDAASAAEYSRILLNLHTVPPLDAEQIRLARRHFHAAMLRRPVPMKSFILDFDANTFGLPDLKQNTFLKARSPDALVESSDLGLVADWILNGESAELFGQTSQGLRS
jgi:hypothetical protein